MQFDLPSDAEKRLQIVRALPRDWAALRTKLWAPRELYQQGKIAYNTELFLDSHGNVTEIKGECAAAWEDRDFKDESEFRRTQTPPELLDLVTKNKLVALVTLEYAGGNDEPIPFADAVDLTAHFVERGYKGFIQAYSSYDYYDSDFLNHANVDINYALGRILINFPNDRERQERLGDFLTTLHTLGLRETKEK